MCVCEECLCERLDSAVAELKSCKYGNGPICDSEGRYNIAKMRATWETLTLCGISWTVLSWKNRLEPGACFSSSVEEAAMKLSCEILRNFNPALQKTPRDLVRDDVRRFYGAAADDNHLPHAFQYIFQLPQSDDYKEFMYVATPVKTIAKQEEPLKQVSINLKPYIVSRSCRHFQNTMPQIEGADSNIKTMFISQLPQFDDSLKSYWHSIVSDLAHYQPEKNVFVLTPQTTTTTKSAVAAGIGLE